MAKLKRTAHFKFSDVGLEPGDKIHFLGDPRKRAMVLEEKKIYFEGQVTSLSHAAMKIKKVAMCRGPSFWCYGGETLTDMSARLSGKRTV